MKWVLIRIFLCANSFARRPKKEGQGGGWMQLLQRNFGEKIPLLCHILKEKKVETTISKL